MKINQLTPSEESLMNIMWKLNSAYMREVIDKYPEPKPHQNTISTFMKILVEKDFLTTEKEGRIFKYTVAVPFEDYRKFILRNFLDRYFENSATNLTQLLMEDHLLKSSDFKQFFEIKTTLNPIVEKEDVEDAITYFIEEITASKKEKKRKKKKKKKKKKLKMK